MQSKLQAVEVRLKRWHTKLVRASNEVAKLEKKRRRLMLEAGSEGREVVATVKVKKAPEPKVEVETPLPELDAYFQDDIPAACKAPSTDVNRMKDERKAREAAERKKMPLSGREAMKATGGAMPLVRQKQPRK